MELRAKADEGISGVGRHGEIIDSFDNVCVISLEPHAAAGSGNSYGKQDYKEGAQNGGQNKPKLTTNEVTHECNREDENWQQ
jgi:hypothetical protein